MQHVCICVIQTELFHKNLLLPTTRIIIQLNKYYSIVLLNYFYFIFNFSNPRDYSNIPINNYIFHYLALFSITGSLKFFCYFCFCFCERFTRTIGNMRMLKLHFWHEVLSAERNLLIISLVLGIYSILQEQTTKYCCIL